MQPSDGRDAVASVAPERSRADVLECRITQLRAELNEAWSKGFARRRVDALLESIRSCQSELRAIRRDRVPA